MFSPIPTLVASFLLVISSVYAAGEFENYEILDSTTDNATVIRDILAKNGTGAVGGVSFLNGRANIFLEVAEIVNKTTVRHTFLLLKSKLTPFQTCLSPISILTPKCSG